MNLELDYYLQVLCIDLTLGGHDPKVIHDLVEAAEARGYITDLQADHIERAALKFRDVLNQVRNTLPH